MGAAQEMTVEYRVDVDGVTVRQGTLTNHNFVYPWDQIVEWCNGIGSAGFGSTGA